METKIHFVTLLKIWNYTNWIYIKWKWGVIISSSSPLPGGLRWLLELSWSRSGWELSCIRISGFSVRYHQTRPSSLCTAGEAGPRQWSLFCPTVPPLEFITSLVLDWDLGSSRKLQQGPCVFWPDLLLPRVVLGQRQLPLLLGDKPLLAGPEGGRVTGQVIPQLPVGHDLGRVPLNILEWCVAVVEKSPGKLIIVKTAGPVRVIPD